jgi:hypothetical protein
MHLITQGQVHHGNTRGVFLLLIKLWANRSRDFPFRYFQTKLKCGIIAFDASRISTPSLF